MTTSLRTNAIDNEDMRALCGPVPHDGKLAAVVKDGDSWRYQLTAQDPRQPAKVSDVYATPEAARKGLAQHFTGEERRAWETAPFTTLPPGQGWYRQRVGDRELPVEAVLVRACYVNNADLARAAAEKVVKPNAHDAAGTTLLTHAAGLAESREPMDTLLAKGADPKRANEQGWTPAHAAALTAPDRLKALVKAGASLQVEDQAKQSPYLLLPVEERRKLFTEATVRGPRPNPSATSSKTLPPRPAAPGLDKGKTKSRDVRSF